MAAPEPYKLADAALKKLQKKALKRAENVKSRLRTLKFDELNVMTEIDSLYEELDSDSRKVFEELYIARYLEMCDYLKHKKPDEDILDELLDMELAGLLSNPNEATHYTYETETLRKRDRAKESVLSSAGTTVKQIAIDKAIRYWLIQVSFYLDFVSQDAELQALEDAGIEQVQRHEMMDAKTCNPCRDADGEIYYINEIPALPHLRCRRWFTPVGL